MYAAIEGMPTRASVNDHREQKRGRNQDSRLHEQQREHDRGNDECDAGSRDAARETDDRVVEHGDGRIRVDLPLRAGQRLQRVDRVPRCNQARGQHERPARRTPVDDRTEEADQDQRHEVEEVAVVDVASAEAEVENRYLEEDADDRN